MNQTVEEISVTTKARTPVVLLTWIAGVLGLIKLFLGFVPYTVLHKILTMRLTWDFAFPGDISSLFFATGLLTLSGLFIVYLAVGHGKGHALLAICFGGAALTSVWMSIEVLFGLIEGRTGWAGFDFLLLGATAGLFVFALVRMIKCVGAGGVFALAPACGIVSMVVYAIPAILRLCDNVPLLFAAPLLEETVEQFYSDVLLLVGVVAMIVLYLAFLIFARVNGQPVFTRKVKDSSQIAVAERMTLAKPILILLVVSVVLSWLDTPLSFVSSSLQLNIIGGADEAILQGLLEIYFHPINIVNWLINTLPYVFLMAYVCLAKRNKQKPLFAVGAFAIWLVQTVARIVRLTIGTIQSVNYNLDFFADHEIYGYDDLLLREVGSAVWAVLLALINCVIYIIILVRLIRGKPVLKPVIVMCAIKLISSGINNVISLINKMNILIYAYSELFGNFVVDLARMVLSFTSLVLFCLAMIFLFAGNRIPGLIKNVSSDNGEEGIPA